MQIKKKRKMKNIQIPSHEKIQKKDEAVCIKREDLGGCGLK